MKTSLSSLDIAALVAELRPKIVNSWINNIYSIGKNRVILRFRKTTESPFEMIFELGKRFHMTKYFRKKPTAPNNKILSLRKHIRDLPVKDFYQIKLDRVLVFEISYKDGFYKLILELFGGGNIILVGPNNKIILAYVYRRMRDRDIHPGKEFKFPPSSDLNISTITKETFFEQLSKSSGKVVNFLNEIMGLGPLYSKDILLKANVTTKTIEELQDEEKNKIFENLTILQKTVINKDYVYYKYIDEDEIVDITPIALNRYDDLQVDEVDSFNDELDEFFSTQEEEPEFTEDKTEASGKLTKLQKILKDQEKHLKSLIEQEEKEKKKGDLLYANFSNVDELLTTILKTRRNGVSWTEIEEKLILGKEKGITSAVIFEEIKPKNKLIVLNLSDEKGEESKIELDFTLPLVESANSFYEKSKKARRKVPGAEAAINRSKKQIDEASIKKEEIEKEIETKPMIIKRSKRWYEKFHWFICKDHVVIGGTDAKTNERILKTYLDDNDLFFHADVHGAPYVVVKEGQTNLSEECVNEIAIFALNYSSIWKEKKLVGDVYNVLPDQVSLTAPSGQYLAKGSVMIYGTKNYQKNVEINHAVGIVIFDQHAQVIGGPVKSVEERTPIFLQIKPGDVPKGKIAKEIREILLKKCSDDEKYKVESLTVNEFLPFIPGDSKLQNN